MQRVLVTAGASGIGYALAEAFYAEGYKVWIIDVSEKRFKKNVQQIGNRPSLM